MCRETTNAVQGNLDSGFPNSPHKPTFTSLKNPRGERKTKIPSISSEIKEILHIVKEIQTSSARRWP